MQLNQLVQKALWLSFWETAKVPTVEWRVATRELPARATKPAFTLKKSTDSAQRQCFAKEGIELEVRQPV